MKQFVERLVVPLGSGDEEFAAAEAALKEGDAEGAAEIYRSLLDEDPSEPRALGSLAQALIALGEIDAARDILETAQGGNRHCAGFRMVS